MRKGLIITLAALAFVVFVAISIYGWVNELRSESIRQETGLNAQYLANQNYLSAYISGFYESLGIVRFKTDKLNEILTDYVKGRDFAKGGESNQTAFINVVVEAVPNIGTLDIADKMVDYVAGQREGYRTTQDKFLDMLRRFDSWRQDGIIQSIVVANVIGVPTNRLEARLGSEITRGNEAREQMFRIVLASQAQDAYRSGTMEPLSVTPDKK